MDFFRRQTIVYPSVQRNKPKAEVTTSYAIPCKPLCPQNFTTFGSCVNEENVAVAFLKQNTSVFPSSAEYIFCKDGYASSIDCLASLLSSSTNSPVHTNTNDCHLKMSQRYLASASEQKIHYRNHPLPLKSKISPDNPKMSIPN